MMLIEKRFYTGVLTLNYADAGGEDNAPLVLLHGGSARWQWLAEFAAQFAATWHVHVVDLRGHGGSDQAPWQYCIRDFADDVVALLQHLPEPAALFGHSLGGEIAVMAAASAPEHVKALVIGDAPLHVDTIRAHRDRNAPMLRQWLELAGRPAAEIRAALREMPLVWGSDPTPRPARVALGDDAPWFDVMSESLSQHDPTMLAQRLDALDEVYDGFDLEALLPKIACPTLLLQGDPARGGLLTDAEVAHALRLLPDGHNVKLDAVGHGLFTENRAAVLRAVVPFLTDARRRRR